MDVKAAVSALVSRGLAIHREDGVIWDPACYKGDVATILHASRDPRGKEFTVLASDTKKRWDGCQIEGDFLMLEDQDVGDEVEMIVSYPPSGGRAAFIRHALELMKDRAGAVLLFMPITMHGNAHKDLFSWPYAGMFIIKYTDHAWFYWDWRRNNTPPIREVLDAKIAA